MLNRISTTCWEKEKCSFSLPVMAHIFLAASWVRSAIMKQKVWNINVSLLVSHFDHVILRVDMDAVRLHKRVSHKTSASHFRKFPMTHLFNVKKHRGETCLIKSCGSSCACLTTRHATPSLFPQQEQQRMPATSPEKQLAVNFRGEQWLACEHTDRRGNWSSLTVTLLIPYITEHWIT